MEHHETLGPTYQTKTCLMLSNRDASPHLERIATVRFPVDHLHDLLVHRLARGVPGAPVVPGANAILADVEVLGVVDVSVGARLDAVDDLRVGHMSAQRACSNGT